MFTLVFLLCSLGGLVSSAPQKIFFDLDNADALFEDFMKTYNKHYADETEKNMRFELFKKYVERMNYLNKVDNLATFGIYDYADLTKEEFARRYAGADPNTAVGGYCTTRPFNYTKGYKAPESLDYRKNGYVTRVRDQAKCGACWAFAAAGVLEGQYAKVHGQALEFSEQQMLDCAEGTCDGGMSGQAINSAIQKGGIEGANAYPYEQRKGACRFDPSKVVARVTGCSLHSAQSEKQVEEILATTGPLAFYLRASLDFQGYTGGILQVCSGSNGDLHAVLLVGYGTENGVPYWIVKNSWGPNKGEQGYWRIKRNINACGIMDRRNEFTSASVQ